MELKINVAISEFMNLIKLLPISEKQKIKQEIDKEMLSDKKQNNKKLVELLKNGPTLTTDELSNFDVVKKSFSKWTKKLSA
jgi:uncharacterized coiled-coil DUF342 family protein